MNLHGGYMVIHCTTLSSFLYILKFFIIVKKKKRQDVFSPGNSSLPCRPTIPPPQPRIIIL